MAASSRQLEVKLNVLMLLKVEVVVVLLSVVLEVAVVVVVLEVAVVLVGLLVAVLAVLVVVGQSPKTSIIILTINLGALKIHNYLVE